MPLRDWFYGVLALALAVGAQALGGALQARADADEAPPSLTGDVKRPSAAISAYLEGLGALEAARWPDALAAFNRALETEPDDASFVRARGVTSVLLEKFPDALRDLKRAQLLDRPDKEGRIWLAVALQMSGDDYHARETFAEVTNDAYETYLGKLRREFWMVNFHSQRVQRGEPDDPAVRAKAEAERAIARQKFPQAGAWYARRMMDAPALSLALFARARQRLADRDFAGALVDMEPLRARYPKDMGILLLHASSLLGQGDAASARQELTEVLARFTNFSQGYTQRAVASARLGDARRARADLDLAMRIKPEAANATRPLVEKELAALKADAPADPPESLLAALRKDAKAGATDDVLANRAVALRKSVIVRRLQADEVYQQRLKVLEDAQRARPRDPDRQVELADFLAREAYRRFERTLPPGPFRILRPEVPTDPEGEIARALRLVDQALEIAPKHARALVIKALIMFYYHRFGDADTLLQRALAIQEDVPDGLELYAEVITVGAGQAEDAARDLSEIRSWWSYGPSVSYLYTRYPSADELRRAAEFRQLAQQRMARAKEIFDRAIKLRPQDSQGYYNLARWKMRENDNAGARVALEKAVQLNPKHLAAHQALARLYRELGLKDEAYQEDSILINLAETEVEYLLQLAWLDMQRTAWTTAEKLLDRASRQDPAEARVPAFLAVIRTAAGKEADALPLYREAQAMEEARARLMGTTFRRGGTGTRDAAEFAMTLELRLRVARTRAGERKLAEALDLLEQNLALDPRIAVTDRLKPLPSALLPPVAPDPDNRPEADNAAALLAWSHYEAGVVLRTLNRRPEAAAHFEAARTMGDDITAGIGRRAINEPRNRAGFALARLLLEEGNIQAAEQVLSRTDTTVRDSHSPELAAERQRFNEYFRRLDRSGYRGR
jgi:tetratricopeptide (TPR) repeat protein